MYISAVLNALEGGTDQGAELTFLISFINGQPTVTQYGDIGHCAVL
jgi:hypothetical protein